MVRFDIQENNKAYISINIKPNKRGYGFGKILLNQAMGHLLMNEIKLYLAETKSENIASISTFESVGFIKTKEINRVIYFEKKI